MRYTILQSRAIYIVYEEEKLIKIFYSLKEAEAYVRKLEYIDLIKLLMTDY